MEPHRDRSSATCICTCTPTPEWGGNSEHYADDEGHDRVRCIPGRVLKGVAYDTRSRGTGC